MIHLVYSSFLLGDQEYLLLQLVTSYFSSDRNESIKKETKDNVYSDLQI